MDGTFVECLMWIRWMWNVGVNVESKGVHCGLKGCGVWVNGCVVLVLSVWTVG